MVATGGVLSQEIKTLVPTKPEAPKDEPEYEFAMSGKPWKDVFVWLNEKTKMPVLGVAIPNGSLVAFTTPGKKYTIGEVIDIINAALLANEPTQQYYLIRRERDFVLVPANQKIDAQLVPLVEIDDLKKFGRSQLVRVVRPLKALNAEDVRDEFAKLVGPFGNVIAMKPNSLQIQESVANVEYILAVIKIPRRRRAPRSTRTSASLCRRPTPSACSRRCSRTQPEEHPRPRPRPPTRGRRPIRATATSTASAGARRPPCRARREPTTSRRTRCRTRSS